MRWHRCNIPYPPCLPTFLSFVRGLLTRYPVHLIAMNADVCFGLSCLHPNNKTAGVSIGYSNRWGHWTRVSSQWALAIARSTEPPRSRHPSVPGRVGLTDGLSFQRDRGLRLVLSIYERNLTSANRPPRVLGKRAIDSVVVRILSLGAGVSILPGLVARQTDYRCDPARVGSRIRMTTPDWSVRSLDSLNHFLP